MKSVESFCKRAREMGIEEAKIIDPASVVTAEWVRMKCQYGCSGFGESLCCPPRTPTPDMTRKVIDSYKKAILLHQRLPKRNVKPPIILTSRSDLMAIRRANNFFRRFLLEVNDPAFWPGMHDLNY